MAAAPRAADAEADVDVVPDDCGADLLGLLTDTSWVYQQYDHQLFLNTVVGPGDDATVLRLKHPTTGEDTGRGLALTTDGNHRWCAVDARQGTAMVVAEAAPEPGLRRRPPAGPGQLPELRRPRAPRGHGPAVRTRSTA